MATIPLPWDPDYPLRDAVECTVRHGLPNVVAKLTAGDPVSVAYLGGSITAAPGWRVFTSEHLAARFPAAAIREVQAAIGGTNSTLGVYRLEFDVLRHRPDLMFVEFAVNDGGTEPVEICRSLEGIVRQAWRLSPSMDICFVYTVAHQAMLDDLHHRRFPRAASVMEAIADRYGIPSIHVGIEVAERIAAGGVVFQGRRGEAPDAGAVGSPMVFSEDGVHPFPETGHRIYADVVARSLERVAEEGPDTPCVHELGEPMRGDNREKARMAAPGRAGMDGAWIRLDSTADGPGAEFAPRMAEIWRAEPGASLSFEFEGTAVGFYDLLGPDCGSVSVVVDDDPPHRYPRFDGYCTYRRIGAIEAASRLAPGRHSVSVRVDTDRLDKTSILFEHNRGEMEQHPERYTGAYWYLGGITLIGNGPRP